MDRKIRRGDIYFATLDVGIGSEQYGHRPVLVIQNNIGNMFSPNTIVAAITTRVNKRDRLPTHVDLSGRFGLAEGSFVMMEQIFTVDKRRLEDLVGSIRDERTLDELERAIVTSLELREYETAFLIKGKRTVR